MTSTPPAHLTQQFVPATEPQKSYITGLAGYKDVGEHSEWLTGVLELMASGKMDKRFASRLISKLKDMPNKAVKPQTDLKDITGDATPFKQQMLWDFPAGRYAIWHGDGDDPTNNIAFYRVKIVGDSYYYVLRMASDMEYPVKAKAERQRVLNAIADNPLEAAQRYGHEFGHCAICGRGLTRRLSREMGIGPVCAVKAGMTAEMIAEVKQSIIDAGHDPEETI